MSLPSLRLHDFRVTYTPSGEDIKVEARFRYYDPLSDSLILDLTEWFGGSHPSRVYVSEPNWLMRVLFGDTKEKRLHRAIISVTRWAQQELEKVKAAQVDALLMTEAWAELDSREK